MTLGVLLNRRITIQSPPAGRDAIGQPIGDWLNVITDGDGGLWASIVDTNGRELLAGGAIQNPVQTKITIRSRLGILEKMRVLYGTEIYNIEAVLRPDRRRLFLMCSKGVSNG